VLTAEQLLRIVQKLPRSLQTGAVHSDHPQMRKQSVALKLPLIHHPVLLPPDKHTVEIERQHDIPPTAVVHADDQRRLAIIQEGGRLPQQMDRVKTPAEIAAYILMDVWRQKTRFSGRYHTLYSTCFRTANGKPDSSQSWLDNSR
jgi:hypothetical protein